MRAQVIAITAAFALAVSTGCQGAGEPANAQPERTQASGGCGDNTAALPGTGLCQKDASALVHRAASIGDEPSWFVPQGCTARINEAGMPGGDFLLYTAFSCKGTTAQLEFEAGAKASDIKLKTSTFGEVPAEFARMVVVIASDPADPTGNLLTFARAAIDDPAEAAGCSVQPSDTPGFPIDARVVDIAPQLAARFPQDEIRSACGPFGLDQGSQTFWRVFQGFAWHFSLGQDTPEFDPATLTIVRKNAAGQWVAAK